MSCRYEKMLGSELQCHSRPMDDAVDGDCTRHALEKSVDENNIYQKPRDQELAFVLPSSHRNHESSCNNEAKGRSSAATPSLLAGDVKEGGAPKGKSCDTSGAAISQAAAEAWAAANTWAWTVAAATRTVAAGGASESGEIEGTGGSEARASLLHSSDTQQQRQFDSLVEGGHCCSVANGAIVDDVHENVLHETDGFSKVQTFSWRLGGKQTCRHLVYEDSPKLPSLRASKRASLNTLRRISNPELEDRGGAVNNRSSTVVGGAAAVVLARIGNGERAWRKHRQRIGLEKLAAHRLALIQQRERDLNTSQHYGRAQVWRGLQALRAWVTRKKGIAEGNSGAGNKAADALLRRRWVQKVVKMLTRNWRLHLSLQSRDDLAELHFTQQRVPWSIKMWCERVKEERYYQRKYLLAKAVWETNSRRAVITRWISHSLGDGKRRLRLSAWRDALLEETGSRPLQPRPGVKSHENNEAIVIPRTILDGRVAKSADAIDIGAEKVCGVRAVPFTQMDLDTQDRMMPFASKSHDVFSEGPPIQTIGESLQGAYQEEERQDNVVFASIEDNARTGDSDGLEAGPVHHPTNLNEAGALNSCPAYDRDGSKSITTAESATRDHRAATRRLTTFSLPYVETSSPRNVRTSSRAESHVALVTAKRSTTRRRPVVGVDEFNRHPAGFVSPTLEGANASTVTAGKHGLGIEDSYAGERRLKSDGRSAVRLKEINSDVRHHLKGHGGKKRVEMCGSYQVTNQSAVESACYSSVHENHRKRDALGERLANAFWSRRQRATCLRRWLLRVTSNNVQRRLAIDRIARVSKFVKRSSFTRWQKAHTILLVRQTAAKTCQLREKALPRLCASASSTPSCSAIALVALRRWYRRSKAMQVVRRLFCAWATMVRGIREKDKHCQRFLASRGVSNWRRNVQRMSRTRARLKAVALFMLQGVWRRRLKAWRERRRRRLTNVRLAEEYLACTAVRSTRGVWRRGILKRLSSAFGLWRVGAHESAVSRSARFAAVERLDNRLRAHALAVWFERALERGQQRKLLRRATAHYARRLEVSALKMLEKGKLDAHVYRDAIAAGEIHWRRRTGTLVLELLRNCMESRLQVFHQIDTIRSQKAAWVGLCRWKQAAQNLEIQRSASDTGGRRLRARQLKKAFCALANVVSRRVQLHGAIHAGQKHCTRRQIASAVKIWHTWTPRREASVELLKAAAALWRVWMLSKGLRALDRVARARISRRKAANIAKLHVLRIYGLSRWQTVTAARGRARDRRRMATMYWATTLLAKVLVSWEGAAVRQWAGSRQEEAAVGHYRRVCKERALKAWMAFTARSR